MRPRPTAVYDRCMGELARCEGCGGFLNATAAVCPHCDARPSRRQRRRWVVLLGLAGSASLGLTMMACYGAPPCEPGKGNCPKSSDTTTDTGVDGSAP